MAQPQYWRSGAAGSPLFVAINAAGQRAYFGTEDEAKRHAMGAGSGSGVNPATQTAAAGGGSQSVNPDMAKLLADVANNAAQQAYLLEKLRTVDQPGSALAKEQHALNVAQQAWKESYEKASLTGMYEGKPTWARESQEAALTGMYGGRPTLAREGQEQQAALGFLDLTARLRGPKDIFQYLKVLGNTPEGLRNVVDAVAGRYALSASGGGTPGATTQAASLQGLLADIAGGGPQAPDVGTLIRPNQWAPQEYAKLLPTQRDTLHALYEDRGWRPEDTEALFKASLPKYKGPSYGRVRM